MLPAKSSSKIKPFGPNSSEEVLNRIELICGKRPEFFRLNVRDEEAFDDVFSKHPDIDSVIHFAALKVGLVAGNYHYTKMKIAATMCAGKVIRADLGLGCR